jgi:hypothetical protein
MKHGHTYIKSDILFSVGINHKLKFHQQEILTNRWCETFLTLIIEKSSQNTITCPLTYTMSQNNHLHKVMILPKGNFAANTDTLTLTLASSTVAITCSYSQLLANVHPYVLIHTHTQMNMTRPCCKKELRLTQTLKSAVVGELLSSYKEKGSEALSKWWQYS